MAKRKRIPEVAAWTPPAWLQTELATESSADRDSTPFMIHGMGVFSDAEITVRKVPASRATKRYDCPLCNQPIEVGTAHVVVVPTDQPELRRHIHTPCWSRRRTISSS